MKFTVTRGRIQADELEIKKGGIMVITADYAALGDMAWLLHYLDHSLYYLGHDLGIFVSPSIDSGHPFEQILTVENMIRDLVSDDEKAHNDYVLPTHSPYVLWAIEVFGAKYKALDKLTHYHLTSEENDDRCTVKNVTGDAEIVFQHLAKPFTVLDSIETQNNEQQ